MIKITIMDDNGEIILGGSGSGGNNSLINKLELKIDTTNDNATRRGEAIVGRVNFSGSIDEAEGTNIHENLIKLFKWSQSAEGEEEYRTVKIEIFESNVLRRQYEFPKMFVCDYNEIYLGDKGVSFDISLNQRAEYVNTIKTGL